MYCDIYSSWFVLFFFFFCLGKKTFQPIVDFDDTRFCSLIFFFFFFEAKILTHICFNLSLLGILIRLNGENGVDFDESP